MTASKPGRLRKGREFDTVYQEGTVTNGPLFVVRARPSPNEEWRLGVAVGKKIAPKATERNRVKRRIREAVRQVGAPREFDYIVNAKRPALTAAYSAMVSELSTALAKAARKAGTR